MAVDIKVKNTPSYKVASIERTGSEGSEPLRREFQELEKWAKQSKLKTGKYIFHFYEAGRTPDRYRFEACLEIRGEREAEGKIKIKDLPKMTVASVKFNPEKISPRLVYNGVYGWLKENEEGYREAGSFSREVYPGNPFTSAWAWTRAEIQVPTEKKKTQRKK